MTLQVNEDVNTTTTTTTYGWPNGGLILLKSTYTSSESEVFLILKKCVYILINTAQTNNILSIFYKLYFSCINLHCAS